MKAFKYIVKAFVFDKDNELNTCDYSGVIHDTRESAEKELFEAKVHECDNEMLFDLQIHKIEFITIKR